ncbi:cell division GTPase FtsZ [Flavobacterium sp. 28A]|nr:cell division GTPase FtsZ [Flavobacterium sp. 28A]
MFLIAGYGGETATLALPFIAEIIRQKVIITAAFVITPFAFEGEKRYQFAFDNAQNLKDQVDDFLLLDNNKVRKKYGNISTKASLSKMDEIIIKTIEVVSEILEKNKGFEDISKIPISEIGFREYQKVFGNVD